MNNAQNTIIFVHIPKAAGTSIKQAIIEKVGERSVLWDYDRPLARSRVQRNVKCAFNCFFGNLPTERVVFGHFLVGKYAAFSLGGFQKKRNFSYAIFLREPLQRAISHYYFWKRNYVGGHKLWERFTKENWSLERFLLSKEHENFQSQFLWRFPISKFDFVGLSEHFEESVHMLGCAFPELNGLSIRVENANPEKKEGGGYLVDPSLSEEFVGRNVDDYALYGQAQRIFETQRQRFQNEGCLL